MNQMSKFPAVALLRAGRLTALAAAASFACLAATPAQAEVHALLLGIGDYKRAGIPDLQGPPNDIALMREVLLKRFKLPETQVTTLVNPSHSAIEKAFQDLNQRVQPGDQVYIHYSGHGSWAVAPGLEAAGDDGERRGQDQTWVSFGARSAEASGKDAIDVLDKEIALWLHPLYQKTPDVVVVSDSCHSASVTRDVQVGARSADGVPKPHPLRATTPRVPAPTVGLRIGAARDFESAVELDPRINGRCSDPRQCFGVFTWNWAKALTASRPGESWGDVYQRTLAAITAVPAVLQRPQMEGVAERAVFGGKFAPLNPAVPVQEVQADGSLVLAAGLIAGVTPGSVYQAAGVDDSNAPQLKVESASGSSAVGKPTRGSIKAGELVREIDHAAQQQPITLFIGGPQAADVDAPQVASLRQAIEGASLLKNFRVVNRREDAQWRLELVRPEPGSAAAPAAATAAALTLPKSVPCPGGSACAAPELWVVSAQGQLMHPKMRFRLADESAELPRLMANLGSFARTLELRTLGTQGNDTPLQLKVTVLRPAAGVKGNCREAINGAAGWQRLGPVALKDLQRSNPAQFNDCLMFTMVNRDDSRPMYGYLLSIDPNFAVNNIFPGPRANEDEARIEPGREEALTRNAYRLTDLGTETLIFLASESPTPIQSLTQGGMRGEGSNLALKRLLKAGSALTRGTVETEEGAWGAQLQMVEVRPLP